MAASLDLLITYKLCLLMLVYIVTIIPKPCLYKAHHPPTDWAHLQHFLSLPKSPTTHFEFIDTLGLEQFLEL